MRGDPFVPFPPALVAGFPAAYLARVLRRHLTADLARDRLSGAHRAELAAAVRAIEAAAVAWQQRDQTGSERGTAEPAEAADVAPSFSMNANEVAAVLSITPRAVTKRATAGTLPGRQARPGAPWEFDAAAIADLANQEHTP